MAIWFKKKKTHPRLPLQRLAVVLQDSPRSEEQLLLGHRDPSGCFNERFEVAPQHFPDGLVEILWNIKNSSWLWRICILDTYGCVMDVLWIICNYDG